MITPISERLKAPSIGLLIAGILNFLTGIYLALSAFVQALNGSLNQRFGSDAERFGYYVGFWAPTAFGVLSAFLAPIVIYGAIQMMNGKKYGLAKSAAILAVIPVTSCCLIIGVPFGIWALVVLSQPEVKAYFQGGYNPQTFGPPQPPRF